MLSKMKFPLMSVFGFVVLSLIGPLAFAEGAPRVDPCLRARIALDIGSGSTKIRSAVVDTCKLMIVAQLAKEKASLGFRANLKRPGSDGGFEKSFLESSVKTIG